MKCLLCGKALPKLSRLLGDDEFCCREHRQAYHLRQGLNQVLEADHMARLTRLREQPQARPLPLSMRQGEAEPRVYVPALPAAARQAGDCFTPPLRVAGDVGLKAARVHRPEFPGSTVPHSPRPAGGRVSMNSRVAYPAHYGTPAPAGPPGAGFLAVRAAAGLAARPQACLEPRAWPTRAQLPRGRFRIHRPAPPPARASTAERPYGSAVSPALRGTMPVWFGKRNGDFLLPENAAPALRALKPGRKPAGPRPNHPTPKHAPAPRRPAAAEGFRCGATCPPPRPGARRGEFAQGGGFARLPKAAAPGSFVRRSTTTAFQFAAPVENLCLEPRRDGGAMAAASAFRDIAASLGRGPMMGPKMAAGAAFHYAAVALPQLAPGREPVLRPAGTAAPWPPARETVAMARACEMGTAAAVMRPERLRTLRGGLAGTLVSTPRALCLVPVYTSGAARAAGACFAAPPLGFPPAALSTRGGLAGAFTGAVVQEDFAAGLSNWAGGVADWRLDIAGARIGSLALFVPSVGRRDYDLEFVAKIEASTVSWVLRAADFRNYYAVAIERAPGGGYQLTRRAVVDGSAEPPITAPLTLAARAKAALRVQSSACGPDFSVAVEDQVIASWSDVRFQAGGIGFFAAPEDRARLYRLRLSPRGQQSVQNHRGRSDRT